MMGTLFRLFFFASLGLALGWAGFLFVPSLAGRVASLDEAWYFDAFPDGSAGGGVDRPGAWPVPISVPIFIPGATGPLMGGARLVLRHLRVATGLLSFFAVFIAVSSLAGLFVRERLRLGTAYASPTVGFMAKRLVEGAALSFILWTFAPIPAPYWAFYPLGLAAMAGFLAYVANLPLRL
jgi:hypothetical protein